MSGRQWQAGLEEQRVAWSSSERKVMGAVENFLERRTAFEETAKRMLAYLEDSEDLKAGVTQ